MIKNLGILTLVFLLLAGISGWLIWSNASNANRANAASKNKDSFMTGVFATQMSVKGTPQYILHSPSLIHYPYKQSTQIQSPIIDIYKQQGPPWHITSKYGLALNGLNTIKLWNNVKIHRPNTQKIPETTLLTSVAYYYPYKEFAQTHAPVKVIQSNSIVHAKGMNINLKTGVINLLSQAQGEYIPKKTSDNKDEKTTTQPASNH